MLVICFVRIDKGSNAVGVSQVGGSRGDGNIVVVRNVMRPRGAR